MISNTTNTQKYVNYSDYTYSTELLEINLKGNRDYPYEDNTIYLRYKRCNRRYELIKYDELYKIAEKRFLYELIPPNKPSKIYIDIDKCNLSFNQIVEFITDFNNFLKINYQLKQSLSYRIHVSIEDTTATFNPDEQVFKSVHIIFNGYTINNHTATRQIVMDYIKTKRPIAKFIDAIPYTANQVFRAVYQSKERNTYADTIRKDKFIPIDCIEGVVKQIDNFKPRKEDFITVIDRFTDIFIDVKPPAKTEISIKPTTTQELSNHNVIYNMNQTTALIKYINSLTDKQLKLNIVWKKAFLLISYILQLEGVDLTDIQNSTNDVIKIFLLNSRIDEYDTDEWTDKNKLYIFNTIKANVQINFTPDERFIKKPTTDELNFIYQKLKIDYTDEITISLINIKNKKFYAITLTNSPDRKIAYDVKNQILIIDYIVQTSNIRNTKKKQKTIKTTEQYLFIEYQIKKENEVNNEMEGFNVNYVKSLKDIDNRSSSLKNEILTPKQQKAKKEEITNFLLQPVVKPQVKKGYLTSKYANPNIDTYIQAPVGSGKTQFCLSHDVYCISKFRKNKIVIITDTITMSKKQHYDIASVLTDAGVKPEEIIFYKDIDEETDFKKARVLVCCYNSYYTKCRKFKPTHILIDEFINVSKSFTTAVGLSQAEKTDAVEHLFNQFKRCIVKLYDADINMDIMRKIKQEIPEKAFYIFILKDYLQTNQTIEITGDKKALKDVDTILKANRKLIIPTNNTTFIMNKLQPQLSGNYAIITKNGAYSNITNRMSQTLKNELIEDTTRWNNYDCITYSPTWGTGISHNDQNYFYKTIAFISHKINDAQQISQMLYRSRGNLTKTITIATIQQHFYTLNKTDKIEYAPEQENSNFTIFTKNKKEEKNELYFSSHYEAKPIFNIEQPIYDFFTKIEEYNQKRKERCLLYDILTNCYRWGSKDIKCKIYDEITPQDIEIKQIDATEAEAEQTEKHTLTNYEYSNILKSNYLQSIPETKPDGDVDYDIQKTFYYIAYNYTKQLITFLIQNQKKEEYDLVQFYTSEKGVLCGTSYSLIKNRKKDIDENRILTPANSVDYILMYSILMNKSFYGDYSRYNFKNNISNIRFYEVKEIIYMLYENSFVDDNFTVEYFKRNSIKNTDEVYKFIKWIMGTYVAFKIMDIIEITADQIASFYANFNTTVIPINKQKYKTKIEELYNKVKNTYDFICITDVFNVVKPKTKKIDGILNHFLTLCFKSMGLIITYGTERTEFIYISIYYLPKVITVFSEELTAPADAPANADADDDTTSDDTTAPDDEDDSDSDYDSDNDAVIDIDTENTDENTIREDATPHYRMERTRFYDYKNPETDDDGVIYKNAELDDKYEWINGAENDADKWHLLNKPKIKIYNNFINTAKEDGDTPTDDTPNVKNKKLTDAERLIHYMNSYVKPKYLNLNDAPEPTEAEQRYIDLLQKVKEINKNLQITKTDGYTPAKINYYALPSYREHKIETLQIHKESKEYKKEEAIKKEKDRRNEKVKCEVCQAEYTLKNKAKHQATKKHLSFL